MGSGERAISYNVIGFDNIWRRNTYTISSIEKVSMILVSFKLFLPLLSIFVHSFSGFCLSFYHESPEQRLRLIYGVWG